MRHLRRLGANSVAVRASALAQPCVYAPTRRPPCCPAATTVRWASTHGDRASSANIERGDLYSILGIPPSASPAEVKKAFYVRAKQLHPDTALASSAARGGAQPGAAQFIRLVMAYETLSDPRSRAVYDAQYARQSQAAGGAGGPRDAYSGARARHGATTSSTAERVARWVDDAAYDFTAGEEFWQRWREPGTAGAAGGGVGASGRERRGGLGGDRGTAPGGAGVSAGGPDDVHTRQPGDEGKPLGGYPGIARRARRYGDRSVWAALQHARDGPVFIGSGADWPYAWELDERNEAGASADIVQMVVGRSLVGSVCGMGWQQVGAGDARRSAAVPASDAGAPLQLRSPPSPSSYGGADAGALPASAQEAPRAPLASFVASFQQAADGFMASLVGGAPRVRINELPPPPPADRGAGAASQRQSAATPPRRQVGDAPHPPLHIEGRYTHLEFRYQGRLLASAVLYGDGGMSSGAWQEAAAASDANGSSTGGTGGGGDDYESQNYMTIYRHDADAVRGAPLAHVLGAQGTGPLYFRRVVACDLVSPEVARAGADAAAVDHLAAFWAGLAGRPSAPDDAASAGSPPAGPTGQSAAGDSTVAPLQHAPAVTDAPLPPVDFAATGPFNSERKLRRAVYVAAQEDYAEGVWRKHTVRLVERGKAAGTGTAAAASGGGPQDAAAGTGEPVDDAAKVAAAEDDALAEKLCSPRLRRLSDRPPGSRAAADDGAGTAGGLSPHAPPGHGRPAANDPEHAARWNSSHAWVRHSDTGLDGEVATFSLDDKHSITWRDMKGGAGGSRTPPGGASAGTRSRGAAAGADAAAGGQAPAPHEQGSAEHQQPHDPLLVHRRCATHTLVGWRTPGVHHQRWMRNRDGALEAAGTRVRLPDARFWLWEPRSQAHQRGGFYFECAKRGEREAALHPAVYVLVAAAQTLEQEVARAASEQRGWRRGMAALRDAVSGVPPAGGASTPV